MPASARNTTKAYRQYRSRNDLPADEQVQMQFRCAPEFRARFAAEAERRQVSVNYLIERALTTSLDKWERQKLPD